jgi:N-succinyldiaminopimelate aminotransferase
MAVGDVYALTNAMAARFTAVNLGQGVPDFDGPPELLAAASRAVLAGPNQYAPPAGLESLRTAVAGYARHRGLDYDPASEITIATGCTEALAASIMATVRPGDEVLTFEPYYDYYPGLVALAGGRLVAVPLRRTPAGHEIDAGATAAAVTPRTRLILVNTPHNPTGHVLADGEIALVAELARRHDLVVVSDEVYQDLTYTRPHLSPAAVARERVIVCSSVSKTLSVCGWRVGWALAPAPLTARLRLAHRHMTACAPTPLQAAVAECLDWACRSGYLGQLRAEYAHRRDLLLGGLAAAGWAPWPPEGGFVVLARAPASIPADPLLGNETMARAHGVAGLPMTPFFSDPAAASAMLRFAFCKRTSVIEEAARRLARPSAATPGMTRESA